ncbi:hypothetical protein CsatB_019824 [Cannabis sativa]
MDPNRTEQLPAPGQWTTGFYDCFEDQSNSSTTACILYYAMGFAHCLYGATYRTKLRALFSLPEQPYSDCFAHSCCCLCAMTQEYRELQNRGIDPAIGWQANVEKCKREGLKPPFSDQGMDR